jgi:PKD repeat protein
MKKTLLLFLSGIVLLAACYKEQKAPVSVDIRYQPVDSNYAVPALMRIINNTSGAETYNWIFEGGSPASSTQKDPGTIEYDAPGTYKIMLDATNQNGGHDQKEIQVRIDAPVKVNFTLTNTASEFPPVTYSINNTTAEATWYQWTFEGGNPSTSNLKDPGTITFATPGKHTITLRAGNDRVSYKKDTTISVKEDLITDFDISWNADDNDMEVPFKAIMINKCTNATAYSWSFAGATPASSTDSIPTALYNIAGTYNIILTAKNDKKTATQAKSITLKPNSNLFRFTDVKLGINTAQNSIGCYFSSVLGTVLKSNEVTTQNGNKIDFVFFGLNSSFNYNKILSPDSAANYTFLPIPNAINTEVIDKQEICNCGISLSETQFDAMLDDTWFKTATINQTVGGLTQFDSLTTPRIVLFQTADGRKGALKIKQFVAASQQSYIVCDIKIMKQP